MVDDLHWLELEFSESSAQRRSDKTMLKSVMGLMNIGAITNNEARSILGFQRLIGSCDEVTKSFENFGEAIKDLGKAFKHLEK